MKAFIEYLDYDLTGKLCVPCGDRAVIILDGRESLEKHKLIARENNGKHRPLYKGFTINRGNFKHSVEIYREILS